MIRRILDGVRRRNRLRVATIAMYNEGMCRHVVPVIVTDGYDPVTKDEHFHPELVHTCGKNCPWLEARRAVDEQIGAW